MVKLKNPKKRKTLIHLRLGSACIGTYEIKCRRIPHSPNSLNSMHWALRDKWKKAWEQEVLERWLEERERIKRERPEDWLVMKDFMPFKRIHLQIIVMSIQPQDFDNSIASLKGVIDGLVKAGILLDDTLSNVIPMVNWVKASSRNGERIEMTMWMKE